MIFVGCFEHWIKLSFGDEIELDSLFFWIKRFCPSVSIDMEIHKYEIEINCIKSDYYDLSETDTIIQIYGNWLKSEDFLAKYVTQVMQKILIKEKLLIIPASCVEIEKNKCILFIGDFWQGKTISAANFANFYSKKMISDNYVMIRDGKVCGCSDYVSLPEIMVDRRDNSFYKKITVRNNRIFYERKEKMQNGQELNINGLFIPYVNKGMNDLRPITEEESIWFLYQKLTRLLCGETVLFHGELPTPCYLNHENSKTILQIVRRLLEKNTLIYVSSSIELMPKLIGEQIWE